MSFRFVSTNNPSPYQNGGGQYAPVTWTVASDDNSQRPVKWKVMSQGKTSIVANYSSSSDGTQCTFNPNGTRGWTTIWAHPNGGGQPLTRAMAMGQLLAYFGASCDEAPTNTWSVYEGNALPPGVPSFSEINQASNPSGMSYWSNGTNQCLVLNYSYLSNLHSKSVIAADTITNFAAIPSTQGNQSVPASSDNIDYYAYAPDGTLWKLNDWGPIQGALPTKPVEALAWVPDAPNSQDNLPAPVTATANIADESVMCFLLNQAALVYTPNATTFYTFKPATSKS